MSEAARDLVATEGYDPAFGARPLKRAIQRLVLDGLAMELLEGRVQPGDRVHADVVSDPTPRLAFSIREQAEAA